MPSHGNSGTGSGPRPAGSGDADPWYDGRGWDASEMSAMFGFGTVSSGMIETADWPLVAARREGASS